jgi:hypothetical protein
MNIDKTEGGRGEKGKGKRKPFDLLTISPLSPSSFLSVYIRVHLRFGFPEVQMRYELTRGRGQSILVNGYQGAPRSTHTSRVSDQQPSLNFSFSGKFLPVVQDH